jgi:hypothetical protein
MLTKDTTINVKIKVKISQAHNHMLPLNKNSLPLIQFYPLQVVGMGLVDALSLYLPNKAVREMKQYPTIGFRKIPLSFSVIHHNFYTIGFVDIQLKLIIDQIHT